VGDISHPLFQFLDPKNFKMSQFLSKWIFLVSIELIHNPEHVQIVFLFFFYYPGIWKKLLGPETDKMCQFMGPNADHNLSFWAQK
jgi:hypothetical protein